MKKFSYSLLMIALLGLPLGATNAALLDKNLTVEINKGKMVHLPEIAAVVAIANPDIADAEIITPEMISVRGRTIGETSLVAYNAMGDEIYNEVVTVTHNLSKLNQMARNILPDSQIHFTSEDSALVMSGHVDSPLDVENARRLAKPFLQGDKDSLVNLLTVDHSNQVMLKVRIAEISRQELKRFGINLGAVLSAGGQVAFGLVNGRDLTGLAADSIARSAKDGSLAATLKSGDADLGAVIDALAGDNLIKLLAEPNLTTESGKAASFLAGGEFPIPIPEGNGTIGIEYREYGVGLRFVPEVLSKTRISLQVAPEVSELSQLGAIQIQGFSIPAITTRKAETTVELGSGQSFAIAGLMQHNASNDISKFPGLGDLPVLGALFRSSEFRNDQTELIIIITPYIVHGIAADKIVDPTQGIQNPSDKERIIDGLSFHPTPVTPKLAPIVEVANPKPRIFAIPMSSTDRRRMRYDHFWQTQHEEK